MNKEYRVDEVVHFMMEQVAVRRSGSVAFGFAVCCAGMMSLSIGINLLPPFFTSIKSRLDLSNAQLGGISSFAFIGLVIAILVTGPLADRFGARLFALLGNALIIVGLALLALVNVYALVLAASFTLGIGAGMLDMVLSPIVGALKPENRSSAMNMLHSFYCTGAMVTVLVAAGAIKLGIGYKTVALVLMALPAMVFAGMWVMHVPSLVGEHHAEGRHRLRDLMSIPYFWLAIVAIALGGATEMGMANWLPAYAEKSLGYTQAAGAVAFVGFLGCMTIGRIGLGMIGNPRNVMRAMMVCCGLSVVLFLVASFGRPSALALTGCITAGLAGSALWPSMLAVTADRFPRGGATMFGALAAAGNIGCVVMPWLVGVISDHLKAPYGEGYAMRIGLATGALCPLLMLSVLIWMRRSRA